MQCDGSIGRACLEAGECCSFGHVAARNDIFGSAINPVGRALDVLHNPLCDFGGFPRIGDAFPHEQGRRLLTRSRLQGDAMAKGQPVLRVVSGCGGALSGGYTSGRKRERLTPDTRSMASTCSAGGRPMASQYETVPCDLSPKARARALCPPTALQASSNAALLIPACNGKLGSYVNNKIVSTLHGGKRMRRRKYNASEFWQRLEEAIGNQYPDFNPTALARALGMSQGTIHPWYLGTGLPTLPKAIELARQGGVTVEWLVLGLKPKYSITKDPQLRELVEVAEELDAEALGIILRAARNELLAQQVQQQAGQRATGTQRK